MPPRFFLAGFFRARYLKSYTINAAHAYNQATGTPGFMIRCGCYVAFVFKGFLK